jgi:3-isopropylmalate/(R)-2-methylmalate dehydratase small subunit
LDWGFRALIGTSFADIFANNALKNGLLPVVVDLETSQDLFHLVEVDPSVEVTIRLSDQSLLLPKGGKVSFPIDPFSKVCFENGVDQLGYLLSHESEIAAFERRLTSPGVVSLSI